jgi:hypothetical protein
VLDVLRSIQFLLAPTAAGPVRLDHFRPNFDGPSPFGLVDVRPLAPYEYLSYDDCDEVRTGPAVARHIRQEYPGVAVSDARVVDFLDAMVSNRLRLRGGDSDLSLAIPAPPLGQPRGIAEGLAPGDWLMPSALGSSARAPRAGA